MTPFLHSVLDEDGVVDILADGTAATSWVGKQGYTDTQVIGTVEEVAAGDAYSGGVAYTSDGAVRLVDATSELPAGAVYCGGFAVSAGALCYTTDAVDSSTVRIGGVAVTQDGRVHATVYTGD